MYSEVVAALAATASRLEKERILSTMKGNTHFQSLLKWTFDSFKMFGINKIPKPESYGSGTIQEQWNRIEPVLKKLVSRELSGGRAQFAVTEMLSSLTEAEAEVMTNVIRKDLRCGVSSKTVNKVFPKLIPEFELMLAAQEKSSKVQEHSFIEPKLDGLRCAALYDGEEVIFLSRGGKPFETLSFIAKDVIAFLGGKPGMLDGELCGDNFNETVSGVKRDVENDLTRKVTYTIYDHLTFDEWNIKQCDRKRTERVETMKSMYERSGKLQHLDLIEIYIVHSKEEAQAKFNEFRARGLEGAIRKDFDNMYEFKRSRTISKMKPSETMDLEIIGFEEGSGKYVGMLGALVVDYKGIDCRIGTGFKDKDREYLWNNKELVLGQLCECTFMEETASIKEDAGGKTRHAVYHGLRSFKGDKV